MKPKLDHRACCCETCQLFRNSSKKSHLKYSPAIKIGIVIAIVTAIGTLPKIRMLERGCIFVRFVERFKKITHVKTSQNFLVPHLAIVNAASNDVAIKITPRPRDFEEGSRLSSRCSHRFSATSE